MLSNGVVAKLSARKGYPRWPEATGGARNDQRRELCWSLETNSVWPKSSDGPRHLRWQQTIALRCAPGWSGWRLCVAEGGPLGRRETCCRRCKRALSRAEGDTGVRAGAAPWCASRARS